ncbi:MAG: hypothetical protein KFKLKKLM_01906 [Flavobacteriales bacterium]|nr:hypothetical protein [Flavobacteriales bacterium]
MNFEDFKDSYQKKSVVEYQNEITAPPLLSVCIQSFNHVKFIKECLDGILMQQTNFDLEILLGEDASTDGTREICIEYAQKNPTKIRLFLHHRQNNISINGSPTGRFNFLYNLYSAKGKYIALCEGDDYWTDPYKLQKQVDFLEANPDFNICFTKANVLKNNELELHTIPDISADGVYLYDDLLEHYNFITTASVLFRKNFNDIPSWIYQLPYGDMGLYCLVSKNAKIKCLPEISSVYRIHDKGMWSGIDELKKVENQLKFYQVIFNQLTSHQNQIVRNKQKALITKISYQLHKKNRLLRVLKRIKLGNKYKL